MKPQGKYRVLDLGGLTVMLCKLPKAGKKYAAGFAQWENGRGTVLIDLSRDNNPVRTLIHEVTHLLCPELSERRVLKLEQDLWCSVPASVQLQLLQIFMGLPWVERNARRSRRKSTRKKRQT